MRVGEIFKISPDYLPKATEHIRKRNMNYYKKGRYYKYRGLKIGRDGDDFVRDLISIVIEHEVFKCPRFIVKIHS